MDMRLKIVYGMTIIALLTAIITLITAVVELFNKLPTPTPTSAIAIATSTLTPVRTLPTATAVPEPSSTPTPRLVCSTSAHFQNVPLQLGCPTQYAQTYVGYQIFESGYLIWHKVLARTYAVFRTGQWDNQPDPASPPGFSCKEAENYGSIGPIFGFGKLWCERWKDKLGRPLQGGVNEPNAQVEEFEKGMIIYLPTPGGFALYSNGTWEPYYR